MEIFKNILRNEQHKIRNEKILQIQKYLLFQVTTAG